jgi:acetyl esterase/lipase
VIPLDSIASDAVALIAAFRDNGSLSFGSLPIETSRDNYERSCAANGLDDPPVRTVDYEVAADGGSIRMRHYSPASAGAHEPATVFIHGGGWVLGSLATHDSLARRLAILTGHSLLAVEYRLSPEHRFPVPLSDCIQSLKFIRDHGDELGVDPMRLTLVGDSAGGGMVAALANDPMLAVAGTQVVAQVLLYPVTDLGAETESYARIDEGFPLIGDSMRWFRSLYLTHPGDALDPRASPIRLASPVRTPPRAFVVTVGLDPLCDEGIAYAGYLARHGGRVEHHHLPHHSHGIFTSAGKIETGARYLARVAQFITEAQ